MNGLVNEQEKQRQNKLVKLLLTCLNSRCRVSFRALYCCWGIILLLGALHSCCEAKTRCDVAEETWQTKEHLTTITHFTDIVSFFEHQNIPFRFFPLKSWQLTNFCNIPWMAVIGWKTRKQKLLCGFKSVFV